MNGIGGYRRSIAWYLPLGSLDEENEVVVVVMVLVFSDVGDKCICVLSLVSQNSRCKS